VIADIDGGTRDSYVAAIATMALLLSVAIPGLSRRDNRL
jgi:hypothetical protein